MKKKPVYKHEIVSVLRTFSKSELKKFRAFLSSPYFPFRLSLKTLLDELIQFHPLYTHVDLTKRYLYDKVYPGHVFNEDSLRDLLSSLHEAALIFMSYENVKKDVNLNFNLVSELKKRDLVKQLSAKLYNMTKIAEDTRGVDTDFFMLNFKLAGELNYYDMRTDKYTTPFTAEKLIEQTRLASIYVLLYFITEITANYTNLIVHADRFESASLEEHVYDAIKGFSPQNLFSGFRGISRFDFIVDVYSALLDAFIQKGSWNAYQKYKEEVEKNFHLFSSDEVSFQYSRLISCAIFGTKTGRDKEKFDIELLTLYQDFLNKNLYIDKKVKYVPAILYRSVIFHGVKMNSLNWLYEIISGAAPKLHPDERDNLQSYALAQYYFASGSFEESLNHINKFLIDDFIFKYDIYELKIRIYYHLKMYEPALELIHTFRQFIRKDSMATHSTKVAHRNFAYFAEKLSKGSIVHSRIDMGYTLSKLQKTGNVYLKNWLEERMYSFTKPAAAYKESV